MRYRVIKGFFDLDDCLYRYSVGDVYPRIGISANESRCAYLASDRNKLGTPVIEKVQEKKTVKKQEQ